MDDLRNKGSGYLRLNRRSESPLAKLHRAQELLASQPEYKHAEAFMVMQYQCRAASCAHIEPIWNTRDGVTPFMIDCPKCDEPSRHIDMRGDVRVINRDSLPLTVRRVFVGSPENPRLVHRSAILAASTPIPDNP